MYRPTSSSDPIREYGVPEAVSEEYQIAGVNAPGFYFWDKDFWQVTGPFDSLDTCKKALLESGRIP